MAFRTYTSALAAWLLLLVTTVPVAAQATGIIRGQVLDPAGAAVPKAAVTMTSSAGIAKSAETDNSGQFTISGLTPGDYSVKIAAPGFSPAENIVAIAAGKVSTFDAHLTVAADRQEVTVAESDSRVDVDPANNASAVVLKGDDLNILSDNSTDLAADLQALAGPGTGPNGGQILVDGFSGGQLPPKESIREIRINSNPFSAEYDRNGMGRIEILTRPGTDKLRGSISYNFADSALNARNPFSLVKPATQWRFIQGNVGGSITKKSSFTFDGGHGVQDSSALINAQIVNDRFEPVNLSQNVLTPTKFSYGSPRVDYAVAPNLTLQLRYSLNKFSSEGGNIGQFTLPSRATDSDNSYHNVQFTETQVIGTRLINESRFQYSRNNNRQTGDGSTPALNVTGAFNGGGANNFNSQNENTNYEYQSLTSYTRGRHFTKFGLRLRYSSQDTFSMGNFNGSYTFTSIDSYITTLKGVAQGLPFAQIQAMGGGPRQYSVSGGIPQVNLSQWDVGPFIQDDFRYKPNLTVSLGLRYEAQTNIGDKRAWAPRVGIAWGIGPSQGARAPKTVLRLGWGVFYERVGINLPLQALRQNGITQQNFLLLSPAFYPTPPPISQLVTSLQPQAIYRLDQSIQSPEMYQAAVTLERQLPKNITLSATYTNSRGVHQLRSRNINAPVAGIYPSGSSGQSFLYESSALYRQNQLTLNVNARVNAIVSLFGYYNYSRTYASADGSGSFPANNYDLSGEWGRSNNDMRHRSSIGGNLNLPLKFQLSPSLNLNSSGPVNIVTGTDLNGDTNFNDRPAFATVPTDPAKGVIASRWGTFNTDPVAHPQYGSVVIPRNYGTGYNFVGVFLRLARTFTFGESPASPGPARAPVAGKAPGRYSVQFALSARNALNHVNRAQPVSTLSSPFFGQALQSIYGANANRRVELTVRVGF